MESFVQDIRYAVRTLVKSPGLVAVAVLSLGLGIGVNATVFSCVNALFLRPYPYRDAAQLVALWEAQPSRGITETDPSYANFVDWRAGTARSFDGLIAAYDRGFNIAGGGEEPENITGESISWNTFRMLGVRPILGRDFLEEEEQPTRAKVTILSHRLWTRMFKSDSTVVNRVIILNGDPYTVVGVMPPPHMFPNDAQLWVPIDLNPAQARGNHFLDVFGRLRDGVTRAQAEADLATVAARLSAQYPETNRDWTVRVTHMREAAMGEYKSILAIMMGAVGFVLLIA